MSKHFEDLAKNLASGMSRRKAFGHFAMGIGAAAAGLILRRPAHAEDIGQFCVDFCRSMGATAAEFGQCVSDCVNGIGVNVNSVR